MKNILVMLMLGWFLYIPCGYGSGTRDAMGESHINIESPWFQKIEVDVSSRSLTGAFPGSSNGCARYVKVKDGKGIVVCGTYYLVEE
jgi:hypothetical protein